MKKAILTMLMVVIVATPCFAEIETDNILSLDGTLWEAFPIVPPSHTYYVGFSMGKVYSCFPDGNNCSVATNSFYLDLFWAGLPSMVFSFSEPVGIPVNIGLLMPIIGIGAETTLVFGIPVTLGILTKTSDTWTPPSE